MLRFRYVPAHVILQPAAKRKRGGYRLFRQKCKRFHRDFMANRPAGARHLPCGPSRQGALPRGSRHVCYAATGVCRQILRYTARSPIASMTRATPTRLIAIRK